MSNENVTLPRDVKECIERRELFKQVALAVLTSRPALVLDGAPNGKVLSKHFLEDVSTIAEGIFAAAKTFGEE